MTALAPRGSAQADVEAWRADVIRRIGEGERFAGLFATATTADRVALTAVLAADETIDAFDVVTGAGASGYPALASHVQAAAWYEREIHDTFGLRPEGHPRLDPLVLPLPAGATPPRPGAPAPVARIVPDEYAWPSHVLGEGLFTIPHGPVRSGVFESVEYLVETPGEDIPHIGIRVWAKHRGVEQRFIGMDAADGVLLAERVEGIASVAHALAFCHAVEKLAGVRAPGRAAWLRVLHAELERIANHLDVAMKLADAAGLAVAAARFGLHKEQILRLVGQLCGSRFGRGVVVPGGVTGEPRLSPERTLELLGRRHAAIRADALALMATPSFLDRLRRTGPLNAELARTFGALGPVGRASGYDDDDRRRRPYDGYARLDIPYLDIEPSGDALARLRVRWREMWSSFAFAERAVERLREIGEQSIRVAPQQLAGLDGRGVGWAEAPQGEVVYVLDFRNGRLARGKPRSASFHNLALFHDVFKGDILTDFPFIEASFGLSIAGVAG